MKFKRKGSKEVIKPSQEIIVPVNEKTRFRIHLYKNYGRGKLFNYVYQLETIHEGKWKPVVRYNNFHGFIHKDIFDVEGNKIKRELLGKMSIKEATKFADKDLRVNYEKYISEFIEGSKFIEGEKK